jgi:hypothetical protein
VSPITLGVERRARLRECVVVEERSQKLVVTAAWFVRAGEDRIDDTQRAGRTHTLVGDSVPRTHDAAGCRRVLERADDRRADGDNPATLRSRTQDG